MIIPPKKLAEAMDVAINAMVNHPGDEYLKRGGFLMLSYLLQAMNLKMADETIRQGVDKLRNGEYQFDLLNQEHQQFLGVILKQMYGPLGVVDLVILGISGEGKVFITTMHDDDRGKMEIAQIKLLLQKIIDDPDAEDFSI